MRLFSFTNPEFLWLTPLAVFVAWWWLRRSRPAVRFSDTSLFGASRGGRARRAVWGGAVLRALACLTLVLACAGPRRPDLRTRLPVDAVAILMVVDASGSMNEKVTWAESEEPITRLDAAKRAFELFVAGGTAPDGTHFEPRPSDQIGLIELTAVPEVVCPLTFNHSVLLQVVKRLETRVGPRAGTNLGDAIVEAVIRLDASGGAKRKVIIVLSDGQHIQSKDGKDAEHKPREAAQLAANLGFPIYTIDAGGDPAALADPAERSERAVGRETLRAVAGMTGGRAFDATSGTDMLTAYRDIDTLERAPVESYQYRRYFEFYPWCAAAAVVLILIAHVLQRTRWRTLP